MMIVVVGWFGDFYYLLIYLFANEETAKSPRMLLACKS